MKDKERNDYRNMLRLTCEEFESLYRQHQFSDVTAKKLFYRICRVLAKYNKNINQQEDLMYWSRKDVKEVLEPIESSELDMALSKIERLETTNTEQTGILKSLAKDNCERCEGRKCATCWAIDYAEFNDIKNT